MVVEPVRHAMLAIAQLAARDRLVSIDVNYRPALVGSCLLWAERFAPYEPLATIVKASEEDIALAYEGRRTPDAAAAHWLARGAALVLITRGADGASAYMAGGSLHAAAPRVAVVDTVGAGDTFNAGVLAALHVQGCLTKAGVAALPDSTLDAALSLGPRAAAITVSRPGANPPWSREL
jgi:fructokinase